MGRALAFALLCGWLAPPAPAAAADRVAETAALAERAESGSVEAIAALVERIDDPDSKVRYHAEWGLARAGAPAVPVLIAALRSRRTDEERARVARLLGRVGPFAEPAIPDLRAALALPDSSTAAAASYALGHLRAREAVPDLVAAYAASRSIPHQRQMMQALARIGSDQGRRAARAELVESLHRDLESDDERQRAASVAYAWQLYRAVRDDGADEFPMRAQLRPLVPGLVAALGDGDAKRTEQALKALALAGRDAEPALPDLERLADHPTLGPAALEVLRGLASPAAQNIVEEHELRARLEKRIRRQYSLPDHQGRTELLPFRVAGSAEDGLRMSARFLYPGREPSPPSHVVVYLESTSMQPRFADLREITWLADGVPVRMTGLDRSWSRSQLGGVIEQVSARVPLERFFALARARELRARIGGVSFSLTDEDRAALRYLAAQVPEDRR